MYQTKIKQVCSFLLSFFGVFWFALPASAEILNAPEKPTVSAKAAILIDAESKLVLWEKNADQKLSMASTTKSMTALLALEYAAQHDNPTVEITQEMVAVEGSSMGLLPGYKLTLHDIAAGMMMTSGNDAANALAIYIGQTRDDFAALMNARAKEIGMKNTNFVTPSGLDDPEHYSTAYDMALLAAAALKNADFAEIVRSSAYRVTYSEPKQTIRYRNHNKLLSLYEGCIGVKTGFTKKSGRCLLSAAEKNGSRLIAVTLNAPDDWKDHAVLFDYGFSQMEEVSFDETALQQEIPVVGGNQDSVKVSGTSMNTSMPTGTANALNKTIHLPRFLYAPLKEGDIVGSVQYYVGDHKAVSVPIKVTSDIQQHTAKVKSKKFLGLF